MKPSLTVRYGIRLGLCFRRKHEKRRMGERLNYSDVIVHLTNILYPILNNVSSKVNGLKNAEEFPRLLTTTKIC